MPSSETTVMANEIPNDNKAPVVNGTETLPKPSKPNDVSTSFLRAARAGQLDKVLQLIEQGVQINTSNANGLNALHLAAKDGHVEIVEELLTRGCNVDAATRKGNTALHIAALAGQEEVARALVGAGAQVNAQSSSGFTPLYMASQEGHHAVVSFLLSKGANQGLSTEDGFTPLAVAMQQGHDKVVAVLLENDSRGKVRLPALHIAAKKDDTKAATLLLQNDHNPDVTSKSGFTPLHIAAHYGNQNIANLLLQKGADINFAAKHNITPLHVACKWGKIAMVGLLVDKGANIECRTRDGLTPLHCAARSGHEQVVDQLIEAKAPLAAKTKNGLSALHMAAQGDHVEAARVLLYHSAPVDDITVDYLTALHVAAHCGHVPIARLLLERKADPNARALNGFTPLHIACKKNRVKVVELLLKYGANIEATTESGLTPLHVSCFMGCLNIAALLLNAGATPDASTVRGETPLHLAARANQADLVRLLLRHNATVDSKAREDQTPLHVASRLGNTEIARLLLEHNASPSTTTTDLYTPLHIAAKENQQEIAEMLIEHGAALDASTKKGFTPLHLASKYGNLEIARLLLDKHAPIDAQGKNGVTPLHVASHYDKESVGLLLLERGASPHATAKNGFTPLHIAAKKNQMEIGKALLQYKAKPNAESKAGFTPLHLASQEGHERFAAMLLEEGADSNHHSKNGLTSLHLCAQEDKVNVATVLGQHGAEVDATTKGGYTPLHVACHYGQVGMVRWLVNQSAKVNTSTTLGYSPLHQAAQQGHSLVITILLKAGADPNAQTNNGLTPLAIANKLGYITVIETLKEVTTVTTITTVTSVTTTTLIEEKYRVVAPEAMQETFMSDSEDDTGGDDVPAIVMNDYGPRSVRPYRGHLIYTREDFLGTSDHHQYRYMAGDEMKSLKDDSARDFNQDDHDHYRESYVSNSDVMAELHVKENFSINSCQPDNVDIVRTPVHVGKGQWTNFLVSFLVDARGGAMRGCRRSGINIVVPPKAAPAPIRLTCRYLRNRPGITPPLSEAQALATRVLEFSPAGTVFLGPIIIEVPHFVSLRGKERELVVMRSEDGTTWREQALEGSESAVQDILNTSFEGERVLRVVTTTLPQYLAVVSRLRQEVHAVGPEGGVVASTAVPDVQAVFPPNALTKKIKVGLQAQPISNELVSRLFGNRVAVSAIVTVEPRRRKFHKPITLSLPLPTPVNRPGNYSGDNPSLRLLCSITGGNAKAQWEDVTGSTPLTTVKDSVSFTTTVSARFWLMDCRPVSQASAMASQLYHEAAHVPFMAKFVVYAKRIDQTEAKLRIFVMTDDREEKTLEHQEHFTEVAKSRDVEVVEGKPLFVECLGNLLPVTKSGEQPSVVFNSFKENRISLTVRLKDPDERPQARLLFMSCPRGSRGDPSQAPVCTLNIAIPDSGLSITPQEDTLVRGNILLSDLCERLGDDWESLAQALDVSSQDIELIKQEAHTSQERADLTLKLWRTTQGDCATGNKLESSLRLIGRRDLIERCTVDCEVVTDSAERAMAEMTLDGATLDQSGFQSLTDELTLHRTHDSEMIEKCLEPVKEVPLEKENNMDIMCDTNQDKYQWEEKHITADFLAHETSQPTPPLNGTNGFEPGEWKSGKNLWRSPSSEGIREECLYVSERGQMSSDSESGVLISGAASEKKQRHHTTTGSSSGSDVALHEGLSDSEHGSDLQESLPHNGSHPEINQ